MESSRGEKRAYWERRLHDLLRPLTVESILIMSWSIEAMRDGSAGAARRHLDMPGSPSDYEMGGRQFVMPWSIDAIIREKLTLGPDGKDEKRLNLKSWNGVAKLINVYSSLSNAESLLDYSPNEIISAMSRLFWPQYDWQLGTSNILRLGRAWHVYASDEGKAAFFKKYQLDMDTFLKIGFTAYVGSENHPAVRPAYLTQIGVTSAQVQKASKVLGNTLEQHSEWAKNTRNPMIPRDFLRSATKERPFFEVRDKQGLAYCIPSRSNLMLRITDGLYYDIVSDPKARNASGKRFESLCLEVIRHYLDDKISVKPEVKTSYGKSADILLEDSETSSGLIVECKIRRIPQKVLISPDPFSDCSEAFEDIIKGIVQIWRTHQEIYSESPLRMAGVVLQYDPWTIMGAAFIGKLFDAAHALADDIGISDVDRIPVALSGFFDFENLLRKHPFGDIFDAVSTWDEKKIRGEKTFSGALTVDTASTYSKSGFDYGRLVANSVPWWRD